MTKTVFAGVTEVSYGQFCLTDLDMEPPVPDLAFDGQQNECAALLRGARSICAPASSTASSA